MNFPGTRDSLRARRASRRRPSIPSHERTGTLSRWVNFGIRAQPTERQLLIDTRRPLTPSTSESELRCDTRDLGNFGTRINRL